MTAETMTHEDCVKDVRLMARRTALLYYYFVTTMMDELGEDRAIELTTEAIRRYGEHAGRGVLEQVRAMGLSNDIENYSEGADLPSVGWEHEMAETEQGPRLRVTYCPLAAVWKELGADSMARHYCWVDQAKYRAFNPRARLVHTRNLLDGDPFCEFDIGYDEEE